MDGLSLIPGKVKRFFSTTVSRQARGLNHLPIQWLMGAKRPGSKVDHSPASSVKVKNSGVVSSLPIRLHGVVLNCLINSVQGQLYLKVGHDLILTHPFYLVSYCN
jgi:hypothetical protein